MKCKTSTLLLLISVFLLAIPSICQGQEYRRKTSPKRPTPNTESTEPRESPYLNLPFDLDQTKLPSGFKGHNFRLIHEQLQIRGHLTKDSYETSEEFQRRKATLESSPVHGSVSVPGVLAFVIDPILVDFSYDADRKRMRAHIPIPYPKYGGLQGEKQVDQSRRMITTAFEVLTEETYLTQNLFGAIFRVEKQIANQYAVTFGNEGSFSFPWNSAKRRYTVAEFPAEVEVAKTAQGKLRILLVGDVSEKPFSLTRLQVDKPTPSDPKDTTIRDFLINSQLLEVWVFHVDTGEVLFKRKRANP